ncbi:DNA polymerase III subunit delta' [Castellaniella sp.]|uniref:DNA polymerase III subunit delta' n=1 Tax=Castellaniella sp. TaxID=1955812 RepID=UPI0025C4111B|nr:DNA polymerase III subunit delta' [Castellaniella sp.]
MSSAAGFFPWQVPLAQRWLGQRDRFAHAWLIQGAPGIGQLEFAQAGAASLLCETPENGLACGRCQACRWVAAGNHPDLRRLRPDAVAAQEGEAEEEGSGKKQLSKEIRVEQIRGLMPWFNMASHRGGWRVALLYPAEALNVISANALLKILEEPPGRTVFLLVAQAPDRLLPTLVSRCRRLPLPVPTHDEALGWLSQQGVHDASTWLAAAGGAPLLALQAAQAGGGPVPQWLEGFLDLAQCGGAPAGLADALVAQDAAAWIDAAQRLWTDLSLAAHGLPLRYYPAQASAIEILARSSDPVRLAQTARWLQDQQRLAQHTLNPKFLADHAARMLLSSFGKPVRAAS